MLRRNTVGWPSELDLVHRWYVPHLERIHEDSALREADLLQLAQIASIYPSRERFLTELTLDPPSATSDQAGTPLLDEDYLILSTIHSAKGQEWKSVFPMLRLGLGLALSRKCFDRGFRGLAPHPRRRLRSPAGARRCARSSPDGSNALRALADHYETRLQTAIAG